MTALLVIAMASPLWVGFGAIGWQLIRATRRATAEHPDPGPAAQ